MKSEYNDFLRIRTKEVIVTHFRLCRSFQPNTLKTDLLWQELDKVMPSYYAFSRVCRRDSKAVAKQLLDSMKYEFTLYQKFYNGRRDFIIKSTDDIYQEFHEAHPKPTVVIELGADLSETEREQHGFLSYLLTDSERYGWERDL